MGPFAPITSPYRDAFLELEYHASAAYNEFVYRDRAQADAVRGLLFDLGVAEFSPEHSIGWLEQDGLAGMMVCLSAADLKRCRLKSAFALARSVILEEDAQLAERMALAGESLLRPEPGDFYLSRIAVAPGQPGKGLGDRLLAHCEARARTAGADRLVLEVSRHNDRAAIFYRKHGFEEIARSRVLAPAKAITLDYVHMAKRL